mmetsp:Transcript_3812/g.11934  ORF Transcript_3812/g.11934 Transcript_3812/m.11934 type:complete len:202 (-) Transcript_3812:510-1115(-)
MPCGISSTRWLLSTCTSTIVLSHSAEQRTRPRSPAQSCKRHRLNCTSGGQSHVRPGLNRSREIRPDKFTSQGRAHLSTKAFTQLAEAGCRVREKGKQPKKEMYSSSLVFFYYVLFPNSQTEEEVQPDTLCWQTGHFVLSASHRSMHAEWYEWKQGRLRTSSPFSNASKHTEHFGFGPLAPRRRLNSYVGRRDSSSWLSPRL